MPLIRSSRSSPRRVPTCGSMMRDGQPLVATPDLADIFRARRESFAPVRVDGSERLLAKWIARRVARLTMAEPGLEVA